MNLSYKSFVDFLIVFNSNISKIHFRTESSIKKIAEFKNCWELYIQINSEAKLFNAIKADGYQVFLFGEVFQYKKNDGSIEKILINFLNDFREDRTKFEELNGHFLLILWDEERKFFYIWTNRLGTFHAYYSVNPKLKAIGSYFTSVAEVSSKKELDWEGITGFFGFGFFPENRTYFEDIKIFYPASCYIFDENGNLLKHKRYWGWNYKPARRSYKDTLKEFGEILRCIVNDYTKDGKVALPISGGLDSRTIASVIPEDVSIWSFSYGWSKDSQEIQIAEKVASLKGFPFVSFEIKPYIFERLDIVLKCTEGFQDITFARQASVVDKIYQYADYVLAAHWGDVWCSDMGTVGRDLQGDEIVKHILKKIRKHSNDWLLENICKPRLREDPEFLLYRLVEKKIGEYKHIKDIDFRIKAFKTDIWSFRWTLASVRMYQVACFPRLPFYDNRIVDFFLTVPSEFVKDRRLQIDYLKIFKPKFAKIKWQPFDANLFNYKYFNSLLLPKRIFKKLIRLLSKRKVIERNWEMQFLNNSDGEKNLRSLLLRKGLKIHNFVSPKKIEDLINNLYSKKSSKDTGYAVSMLFTFSEWLERNVS